MRFRNTNKNDTIKNSLIIILVLAVVGLGIYTAFHKSKVDQSGTQEEKVQIAPSGIVYPDGWEEATEITASNKESGVISEASHTNPDVKVLVREEAAKLPKGSDISKLPDTIVAGLDDGLEGFTLVSKEVVKIGDYEAINVKYTDLDANQIKHTSEMFVVPTPKNTFYITYRSNKDFPELKDDIAKINQSVANYIKSH